MRRFLTASFLAWAGRLRHPTLFKIVGSLFLLNFLIPDPIPFLDEVLLALVTMAVASWKNSRPLPNQMKELPAS